MIDYYKATKHLIPALFLTIFTSALAGDNSVPEWKTLPLSIPQEAIDRVMAMPPVAVAEGFEHRILVPTGSQLFDPFDFHVIDNNTFWVADDAKGGAIYVVTTEGDISVQIKTRKHPPISLDVAPSSFGDNAGLIYTVAFARPEKAGGWVLPNAVTRINPKTGAVDVVCFLPENERGEAGAGSFFARFGPEKSPFSGKLFITAASNHTIYQVSPDDQCRPFVTIDLEKQGSPRGIAFTPDGNTMLVGAAVPEPGNPAITRPGEGSILQISPEGKVSDTLFAKGFHEPGAMAFAPESFGDFSGQLFISDAGDWDNDIPPTEPVGSDGMVYRVTSKGEIIPVVQGLANPVAVAFIGDQLIVSDINGDFHVGQHKIPIGFIISIKPN